VVLSCCWDSYAFYITEHNKGKEKGFDKITVFLDDYGKERLHIHSQRQLQTSHCFVITQSSQKTIVGSSFGRGKGNFRNTNLEEALEEANRKGYKDPILTKIPNENRSYLL